MNNKQLDEILSKKYKKDVPEIKVGDEVQILMKLREKAKDKNKFQHIRGVVIAKKHRSELGATITVRRIIDGVGIEWTIPIYSPDIEKITVVKRSKTRRAKLYYIRHKSMKEAKTKLKREIAKKESPEEAEESSQNDEQQTKDYNEANLTSAKQINEAVNPSDI